MKKIMNNNTKTLLAAIILVPVFFLTSCSIDDSLNNSPNDILDSKLRTQEGAYGLFVAMQTFTGDFYCSDRSRVMSLWSWQMAAPPGIFRAQPESWDNYILDETGPPNDMWKYGYNANKIADDLIDVVPDVTFSNDATENADIRSMMTAIAKTHKALVLGELAAMFGSIPVDIPDNLVPAQFVPQADAYAKVQQLLDEAIAGFKDAPLDQDLNFGGDAASWTAVAHSLKARYYLHVSNFASALAEANQGMSSGSWLAMYDGNNNREYAPWGYFSIDEQNELRPNKAFVDSLKSEPDDTRLTEYFTPNDSGMILGYAKHEQVATHPDESVPDRIAIMNKYSTYGEDFPMISAEEVILIRAEAKAETGDVGGGITDVNLIRAAAGLGGFSTNDKDEAIKQIMKQKWLELFLEGQDYHDQRRRKMMYDPRPSTTDRVGNFRIMYPISERGPNPNTPANADNLAKPLLGY